MSATNRPVEPDRSGHRSSPAGPTLRILASIGLGTAGAWLVGPCASGRIRGWDQAPIAARWCLLCDLASSLPLALMGSLGDQGNDLARSAILFNVGSGMLSFPLAFAGGFAGKLLGGLTGILTAPFGPTWLDQAVSASANGCLIGIIGGVALPWLVLLKCSFDA